MLDAQCAVLLAYLLWVHYMGSAGALVGHAGLAAAFAMAPVSPQLSMGSLLLFIWFWDLSWAGLMGVVVSEALPGPVRGLGLGLAFACYWSFSLLTAYFFEAFLAALGPSGAFGLFAACSCGTMLYAVYALPRDTAPGAHEELEQLTGEAQAATARRRWKPPSERTPLVP